jgi:hypothetical protein
MWYVCLPDYPPSVVFSLCMFNMYAANENPASHPFNFKVFEILSVIFIVTEKQILDIELDRHISYMLYCAVCRLSDQFLFHFSFNRL